jgi:hypothetical protein
VERGLAEDSGPSVVVHDDASGPLTLSATVEQADLHDPSTPELRSHDDHAKRTSPVVGVEVVDLNLDLKLVGDNLGQAEVARWWRLR